MSLDSNPGGKCPVLPTDRTSELDNEQKEFDTRMMRRAISLARRGEGRVEPNPMVGCVITDSGRVIGEGYHKRFGQAHAEVEALSACSQNPRGATAYVSLEPCSHQGKTGPCADLLIKAGISRVVVALEDPNPAVGGGGIRKLRKAGIGVTVGPLATEAAESLAPYITRICRGRPYVIAKWAQSLDGKLATPTGQSKWISCTESRRRVHKLRARMDAVLVGSKTAAADDPMLNARDVPVRRLARRVILDSRLRISETLQLIATAREIPTLVLTSAERAHSTKAHRLVQKGVEVVPCRQRRGRVALDACLTKLMQRDITNVLVEGGPTVISAFLESGLVDEAFVFVAPRIIGGRNAPGILATSTIKSVDEALAPRSIRTLKSGSDLLYRLRFSDPMALPAKRNPHSPT